MSNTTRNLIAWIFLLLIGLSLAMAVVMTAPRAVRADPSVLYVKPTASGAGDCSSWDDACTLQAALAAAAYGDEIWVASGVYYPGMARTDAFTLTSGVQIYGGFAATETVRTERDWTVNVTVLSGDIDQNDLTDSHGVVTTTAHISGTNAYHVVVASGVTETVVLDGFIITAGQANAPQPDNCGGGMYTYESSSILTNVTFCGNAATWCGGGMYTYESSSILANVTFSGNVAGFGGGMYNYRSSSILTNVAFSDNYAYYGGGMENDYGSSTLMSVVFSSNAATQYGGGMINVYSDPTLTDVTFSGNSTNYGGGVYNLASSPTLANVTFSGNSASFGGGMYNWYRSPTLTNVTFNGNSATDFGGGMYNWYSNPTLTNVTFSGNSTANRGGGICNYMGSPTLTNVTFSDNLADVGGAMYNDNSSSPHIRNSILWGNTAVSGTQVYNDSSNPTFSYSDIQDCGGSGGWDPTCGTDGGHNIDADPRFVDAAGGNLRLRPGSPAIDAGNNDFVPSGVTTDLDGNPRIADGDGDGKVVVDMGAYETQVRKVFLPLVLRNAPQS